MNEESAGPVAGLNEDPASEPPASDNGRSFGNSASNGSDSAALSPSLWKDRESPAFELKFRIFRDQARAIAAWAAQYLQLDPHADPARGNTYLVHGLYFDTPSLDVFHRAPGYKKRKFRLRRYGNSDVIFLEQKRKAGGKVAKRRVQVEESELNRLREAPAEIDWTGHWFHRRIARRLLQPSCLISYERQAYFGLNAEGPLRLTLDQNVRGRVAEAWNVHPVLDEPVMLPDEVLLELKYRDHLPALFKMLIQDFALTPGPVSKYRLAVEKSGRTVSNGRSADA